MSSIVLSGFVTAVLRIGHYGETAKLRSKPRAKSMPRTTREIPRSANHLHLRSSLQWVARRALHTLMLSERPVNKNTVAIVVSLVRQAMRARH